MVVVQVPFDGKRITTVWTVNEKLLEHIPENLFYFLASILVGQAIYSYIIRLALRGHDDTMMDLIEVHRNVLNDAPAEALDYILIDKSTAL